MPEYFFESWAALLRILITSVAGYVGLVVMLRLSGNRTLSKMNSFDFIITITLGSLFSSGILQKEISLVGVLFAMATLIGLQFAVTFFAVRFKQVDRIIKGEPALLYSNGEFLHRAMTKARVTQDEILAGARKQGFSSLEQVKFVILEANGDVSATGRP